MLTRKYRPQTFDEMIGATLARKVLSKIAKDPDDKPKSIILQGERGLGKTTSSRIFARAVNHPRKKGDHEPGLAVLDAIKDGSPLYTELDSAVVGNVDSIRGMRDSLGYSIQNGYRVVVFDECHLASKQAQSALLKILEEASGKVFFLFATTDPDLLLDTIVSRSITLKFNRLLPHETVELLTRVSDGEKFTFSDKLFEFIHRRVDGHARDAVAQLDLAVLMGEDEYYEEMELLDDTFDRLYQCCTEQDPKGLEEAVMQVVRHPIEHIEQDFESWIKREADKIFLRGEKDRKKVEVISLFLKSHKFLHTTNDWYIFFLTLSSLFEVKNTASAGANRFKKKR